MGTCAAGVGCPSETIVLTNQSPGSREDRGDAGTSPGWDPGDSRSEAEHRGRDEHSLSRSSLVEREADLPVLGSRHRDRHGRDRRDEGSRRRHARSGDLPDRRRPAHDDESPRLPVLAAARPTGNLGDRVELAVGERLLRELPDLARAKERANRFDRRRGHGGSIGHRRNLANGSMRGACHGPTAVVRRCSPGMPRLTRLPGTWSGLRGDQLHRRSRRSAGTRDRQ